MKPWEAERERRMITFALATHKIDRLLKTQSEAAGRWEAERLANAERLAGKERGNDV